MGNIELVVLINFFKCELFKYIELKIEIVIVERRLKFNFV